MTNRIINKAGQILASLAYRRVASLPRSDLEEVFVPPSPAPSNAAVYWVGHSLMQQQADADLGLVSLFSWMRRFADFHDFAYDMIDHTLWGAPLSLLWRGKTHSYARSAPEMQEIRNNFAERVTTCTALVLTEVVPLCKAYQLEFSAWYLREFCRVAYTANPKMAFYLYESWDHWQSGDGNPAQSQASWRARMLAQRALWQQLADAASCGRVVLPDWRWQLKQVLGWQQTEPAIPLSIYLVPVGQALIELHDRLNSPQDDDDFRLANAEHFSFHQLFNNPYVPASLNGDAPSLLHPEKPFDDIHMGEVGIYLVALVHFATIYRHSPLGLPKSPIIGEGFARTLQTIAWQAVKRDKRAGFN